jgi:uncharacterized protein (AIM24 family)
VNHVHGSLESDDDPGELIAVPLEKGQAIDVSEHHFLVATAVVSYDWFASGIWWTGGGNYFYPSGRYMDRFTTQQRGLLILHASGNTFIRNLGDSERIYVLPRALVFKDPAVHMNIHMELPAPPGQHWPLIPMIRLTGPGRVAIQSQYELETKRTMGGTSSARREAGGTGTPRRDGADAGFLPVLR